jgi:hypothetical protein
MSGKSRRGANALRAALLGTVALGFAAPVQAAESKDIEALEQQLQMLMQEIQDLKARQAEQDQNLDWQLEKLEAQEQQIESQQEQLETQQEVVDEAITAAPAQAVTGGQNPGSIKMPGTDTSFKIGGYVKADLFYDVNADTGDSFNTTSIPPDGAPEKEGSFRAHARQTRLNVTTWTPTDIGEVKTFIEGDFLGTTGANEVFSNSLRFRLRHAYGQIRTDTYDVLFGQTWTAFMPLTSYPDTVDFFGPTGMPFIRQGQARFSYKGIENIRVEFSVENSELNARDDNGNFIGSELGGLQFGIDKIPDFVGAVEYNKDGWHFKGAAVGRLLSTDKEGGAPDDDSEFGYGLFAGAVIPTFGDDSLQLNFTYGDGVGRYLINGFAQDALIDSTTGDIETIEQYGVAVGYTHVWSDTLYSNLVYGREEFLDTFSGGDFEVLQSIHVNTWWQPADNLRFGLEYIYGMAEFDDSSFDNSASRIQFGAQYFF